MTNPNNAVGTNGAYDGRTSVEAFNDVMNVLSRGIISGWECVPNSGLTVSLGGNGTVRDVAVAEDAAGNRTSINNRSGSPINVTIAAAPASNTRIDAIVAYVDSAPTGSSTVTDNPAPCGIIPVSGTPSNSPVAPDESAIRTAITADGASGTTAFYVVLAYITIASGTTDLTTSNIAAGPNVQLVPGRSVSASNIDFMTLGFSSNDLGEITLSNSIQYGGVANLGNFEAGKYLVLLQSLIRQDYNEVRNIYFNLVANNQNQAETIANILPQSTTYWNNVSMGMVVELSNDGSIVLQSKAEVATDFTALYLRTFVLRVG